MRPWLAHELYASLKQTSLSVSDSQTDTPQALAKAKQQHDGVLRKLKSHSYLRTNPFDVENSLDGLEERFRVNHRDGLADALRKRLDDLRASPSKWHPEIMFLLLELSDQPTFKTRLSDVEVPKAPEEAAEQLRWEDIAREDGWDQDQDLWKSVRYADDSDDDDYSMQSADDGQPSSASEPDSEDVAGSQIDRVIVHTQDTALLSSVLDAQKWRTSRPQTDPAGNARKTGVSETQVAREVLFMLQGLETTLFDAHSAPLPSFQMPHMMWETNKALMSSFGEAGRQLGVLRRFVQLPQDAPHMQAFQDSIARRLAEFDRELADIQATLVSPDRHVALSLISIKSELSASLEPLQVLSGVIADMDKASGPATFRHLELMFDAATVAQLSGKDDIYVFMGRIFMESFDVYLRPVRAWMDEGRLIPGDEVFFICENQAEISLSDLWQKKFQLRADSTGAPHVPTFLRPATGKIMDAGKSIYVLKRLGLNTHYHRHLENEEPSLDFDQLCSPELALALFPDLFSMAFERWIQSKYRATSTSLKDALFKRCGLGSALDTLQHIYLLSDGFAASSFCEDVFAKFDALVPRWYDRYALTPVGHEAFGSYVDTNRLSVDVTKEGKVISVTSARDSVRAAIPHIRVFYTFPWPIQMIVSPASLSQYQSVFTILMQFRRAAYVLHRHKILTSVQSEDGHWSHQALYYSCRTRLLWFCTTIQTYLTKMVLTPNVLRLRERLDEASDVDSIIEVHDSFLSQVIAEACLGNRLTPIRECMLDVLDLAIRLEKCRSSGLRHDVLMAVKTDFERHLRFILEGLRSVARASSDVSAAKWDTLSDMLASGLS